MAFTTMPPQSLGRFWRRVSHQTFSVIAGGISSSALIKQLRERTGAPIKDVKAVLEQCQWDPEIAFTELRKKGLAAASKKSSRVAAEGLLGFAENGKNAVVIEINSETDFVARNDMFQHLVSQVAKAALDVESIQGPLFQPDLINMQALEAANIHLTHPKLTTETTVGEAISEVASITGENVKLCRGFNLSTTSGIIASYLHSTAQPGLARIAGVLTLEPEDSLSHADFQSHESELIAKGSLLAMHVVAARPLYLSKEFVAAEALQRERDILMSQALDSGKPAHVIEKMVEGRLQKYVKDVALLEQQFVVDETKTVRGVLSDLAKQLGERYTIGRYLRAEVGEGIERKEKDFAPEVAAQAA